MIPLLNKCKEETPIGVSRKDDVVLRLQAPFLNIKDSTFISIEQREWLDLIHEMKLT